VNTTGNPGMATIGTGDVLAGVIGGLAAQGMPAYEAASAGVYIHGRAGDLAAKRYGQRSLLASDLLDMLASALLTVENQ
jgi:NAD(P)H-hydrate repair Nnr-like enzyme with NAD(P)H-hydrate dehydratase domain